MLEAAAEALRLFREQDVLDDDVVFDLCVEAITRTVHKAPSPKLNRG